MEININPGSDKAGGAQKHRACDECRTRKLACSKEPDGCSRCKREGIACHYSPQKPMGRPRKRPLVAGSDPEPLLQHEQQQPYQYMQQPEGRDLANSAPPADEALDLSFLDAQDTNFSFLDLMNSDFGAQAPSLRSQKPEPKAFGSHSGLWHYDLQQLDFNVPTGDSSESGVSPIVPTGMGAFPQPALPLSAPPPVTSVGDPQPMSIDEPETTPSLSSNNSTDTPETAEGGHADCPLFNPQTPPACACLASLYLALHSLQTLPEEVGPAMGVTRRAARAAHDAIQCPTCSPRSVDRDAPSAPMQAFQSLMMLGALLPSIASGYQRILTMVEEEATRADAEHRQLTFTLVEYGDLWGRLAELDSECGARARLNGSTLTPQMWRLVVRALLKIDVYGMTAGADLAPSCTDMNQAHLGLKDVVLEMEQAARSRHQQMDALIESGALKRPHLKHSSSYNGKPPCLTIIDIAKTSIDRLVIP